MPKLNMCALVTDDKCDKLQATEPICAGKQECLVLVQIP